MALRPARDLMSNRPMKKEHLKRWPHICKAGTFQGQVLTLECETGPAGLIFA